VVLHQDGSSVRSAQAFVAYDSPHTPVAAKADGTPDCFVPGEVANAKKVAFVFWPSGCTGSECRQVRAFIYQESATPAPIPVDNAILFNCKVQVAAGAPNGSYPLVFTDARTGDVPGDEFPTASIGGAIVVHSGSTPPGGC
jgi:hypothetical protein